MTAEFLIDLLHVHLAALAMRGQEVPMRASAVNSAQMHPDWSRILIDAVNQPGAISTAYSAFWNYSTGNQLLALFECSARGIVGGGTAVVAIGLQPADL